MNIEEDKSFKAYFIPFETALKQLLSIVTVISFILQDKPHEPKRYYDVFDGDTLCHHTSTRTLLFVVYYDEIEVVNPLSKGRSNHKIGTILIEFK